MSISYLEKYPHLFSPLFVGRRKTELKNRVLISPVFGAHLTSPSGCINEAGIDFYTRFARGGFASCCVPSEFPKNSGHIGSISMEEEDKGFLMLHYMQRSVHAFRCLTFAEIYHPGCCMLPGEGREVISADSFVFNGHPVRAMTEKDMEEVARQYVAYALKAKRSGFDGLCLHYAHGWLMNNFLSPLSNHRTDAYGGSVENRCRFPRRVLEDIRAAVGSSMIIELRLNGSDRMEGGITPEDAARQALIFEDLVDMVHVSCSTRLDALSRPKMFPTCYVAPGHNVDGSSALKKAGVKIPVGVVGGISDPAHAEKILADGLADYVLMTRQAIADPDWVNKIREGREDDIRPCIRCVYCLDGGRRTALRNEVSIQEGASFDRRCSVNPLYGQGVVREKYFPPVHKRKKVAVIGGGIAGMQAALTAHDRGHGVVLYERSSRLGGQTNLFAESLWFKADIRKFRDYLIRQVRKRDILIELGRNMDPETIASTGFDAVIVAVGSEPASPSIPGMDSPHVIPAWEVFARVDEVGEQVVIVGGGSVGCEIGIFLAGKKRRVTILEMGSYLAANLQVSERMSVLEHLEKNRVQACTDTRCLSIGAGRVTASNSSGNVEIPADTVVVAAGSRPLVEVRESFRGAAFDVIAVGDCTGAEACIRNAVDSAWCAASSL